eukprot:5168142-Pyramimonas_sp.AAC.1
MASISSKPEGSRPTGPPVGGQPCPWRRFQCHGDSGQGGQPRKYNGNGQHDDQKPHDDEQHGYHNFHGWQKNGWKSFRRGPLHVRPHINTTAGPRAT